VADSANPVMNQLYVQLEDRFNSLNAELNPICHLLALLGVHHILHISTIRVKVTVFTAVI